ncbi:MAG: hypothetical protein FJ290_23825 [Planctomycetes bacterium]|nr:hypothetical protein [Planctomycetota bacterium]
MKLFSPEIWSEKSVWGLVAANGYVLFGALFLGWDAAAIVILYWAENVIIAAYTILKIPFAHCSSNEDRFLRFGGIPFFVVHYGVFCMVHCFFIMALTKWGSPMVGTPADLVAIALRKGLGWSLAALIVSHGISFVENYIVGKEYLAVGPQQLMTAPYGRVVLLHVTILMGAMPVMALGSPAPLVAILVALKTVVDLWLHRRSHAKLRRKDNRGVSDETGTDFDLHVSDEE